MTITEMKNILVKKLADERTYFTKKDINIKKSNGGYDITIKDYECIPFRIDFELDDYFGHIILVKREDFDVEDRTIAFVDSKKDFDFETALIELGYYIGTRF